MDAGAQGERQEEIAAAFCAGRVRGAGCAETRIDTPTSLVLLTQDRAYKIKKPAFLPYVDQTDPQRRRAFCVREMELNAAGAPGLYLRAAAIIPQGPDVFALAAEDAPGALDWCVELKRFPAAAQFDMMARAGTLTPALAAEAAARAALLHAAAPLRPDHGAPESYAQVIANLARAEAEGAHRCGRAPAGAGLAHALTAALAAQADLIMRRRQRGKVRRCHGDMHLRNICLLNGAVGVFDALEFDEALASIDVLYDLAFLLMDLRCEGLAAAANTAMNRYFDEAGEDAEALALLAPFMALRAFVRMAVAAQGGDGGAAARYQALAERLLQEGAGGGGLIAVGGLSGAGKSTVARLFAPRLPGPAGARHLRSDLIRKQALGLAPTAPAPAAAYAAAARAETYRALAAESRAAVQAGAWVIADATFADPQTQAEIAAAGDGAAFLGVFLEAPLEVRLARVAGRRGDASDADAAIAAAQTPPSALAPGWVRVEAAGEAAAVAGLILAQAPAAGGDQH